MRVKVLVTLLACGLLSVASVAEASAHPAASIGGIAQADTAAAPADSAASMPATPAPATPAPAPTPAPPPPPAPAKTSAPNDRIYYGGTLTLSFGTTTRIGFYPMLGYKVSPRLSGGVEVGYEYVTHKSQSTNNYGASVFGRFRVGRSLYAHAEFQNTNYEIFTGSTSEREWVPFVLVGGGAIRSLGGRSAAYVEVLFDVLQDPHSPYGDWEPVINFGVSVGF